MFVYDGRMSDAPIGVFPEVVLSRADAVQWLRGLPEESADLVAMDPPLELYVNTLARQCDRLE